MPSLDLSERTPDELIAALLQNPQTAAMIEGEQKRLAANKKVKPLTKWLINKETGALVPATAHNWPGPHNNNNPHLMPFNSELGPPLTQAEGLLWLASGDAAVLALRQGEALQPPAEPEAFDLASASAEELRAFARQRFDVELDRRWGEERLREELKRLARNL